MRDLYSKFLSVMTDILKIYRCYSVLFIFFLFAFTQNSTAAISFPFAVKDSSTIPMSARAADFVNLSIKEFENLAGHKLSLVEKVYMKRVQKTLKKQLKKNSEATISDYVDPVKKSFKLDPLWFTVGIIIGPLALLFAYTSKQSKVVKKSTLLGFLIWIAWFGYAFVF